MIIHYIIMSSSYTLGTRIALDVSGEQFKGILDKILEECGEDVSVSTHFIPTESKHWTSVVDKDPFFRDVKVLDNVEEFIKLIKKDRVISGLDIAKYILSKKTCTHLKLQKLVYLCYAEYLCETKNELFKDVIYAFKYGPIVDSVYKKYRGKYGDLINTETGEDISLCEKLELPFRSKIIFSEEGIKKIFSIDRTIQKYADLSAGTLVTLTHRKNTPWTVTYNKETMYKKIENDVILKYHENERIQ